MRLTPMGIPGKAPAHVKAWTQQEDRLLISLYQEHNTHQMAERIQRTRKAVMHRIRFLRNRGLIGRKRKAPLSTEAIAFLIKNRHVKTAQEMALEVGCSECTVRYTLRKRGYNLKKCGENHHCARYSDHLVELVTELRDIHNMTFCMIAEHINSTTQMHINGDTALHLYHRHPATDAVLCELLPG
ncbi:DNA-binding protein [Escherichia coli]